MFHKRLMREFKENQSMIAGMVLTQWLMLFANIVLMIATADMVEAVVKEKGIPQTFIQLVVTLFLILIVRGFLSYWNQQLSFCISKQLKERLRALVYEKLMRMGSNYKNSLKTAEIVQISTEGVEQLEIYFGKYVPQFFYSMIAPLTLFVIVGEMSLKVALVLLLCVPLIPISIIAVQKFAKKMLAKYWGTYTQLGDSFLECLQGLTTLKIYQADERYAKKMDEESENFRKITMRVLVMQLNSISVMDLVAYGGTAVGIVLSILELQKGAIHLPQCFFIMMISSEFFLPLRLLGSFFHIAMNGNAAADKIFALLDEKEETVEATETEMETKEQGLKLEQVSFSYEENQPVLKGISMTAKKGLTAIVGESGCGKSTLVSLLMKEQKKKAGNIRINGRKIEGVSSELSHKKITRVCHDSYLFAGTVRENLLMGKEDASDEEMLEALRKVNLLSFVRENGGLSMVLLEKASNLSGGQKQRLALARALLHQTDVYLFDEATSNIDVESENDIMQVISQLAKEKVVLLISHRLANVTKANQIYVMKNGTFVEHGTHDELLGQEGYYAKLFLEQKQLERYQDKKVG
ncbi:ABC transporter ATP-binding protein/permease [Roseburia sp. 831b]|uniref:ABC transporter ATP-binding protein/permease n=1 Tax=Roseburia sp. 831b TaxID=1261635 RepID=UPI000951B8E6|nr:ABC transporter ATP-binding protein/permease [Roseburia sp. 831b]WVK71739.1 ABC transporter ATP-binding protein/permease [Roseburia sp. 831b]